MDDIILTSDNPTVISDLKQHIHKVFTIKNLGQLNFFLGTEIIFLPEGITMTKHKFTQELPLDSDLTKFKDIVTPLPINLKVQKANSYPFSNPQLYNSLVIKLNFLTHTGTDLAYTIQTLTQYIQHSPEAHF